MTRVLFFDIDGVVNSERSNAAFGGYPHDFSAAELAKFDPVALALIRKLCDACDAWVVLSSTWRLYHKAEQAAAALELPVIDVTPDHGSYDTRASEIAAWLAAHPEITQFAIVDDVPVFDSHPELQARFVQTDPMAGLSLNNYRSLRHLLSTENTDG